MYDEEISERYIAHRRPHYHLRNNELYFLISTRPSRFFSTLETAVWSILENPTVVSELISVNPEYLDVLANFHDSEIIELVEVEFPAARKKILVVEPHADDAALSVGGTMWQMRHEVEFTVLTVANRSNFTSYYNLYRSYFNIEEVSALRREESKLFCRMVGGHHRELGLTDAVLRYSDKQWDLSFFKEHRTSIAVATSRLAPLPERLTWKAKLEEYVKSAKFDEIWIPLGSPHSDHSLTTSSIFQIIKGDPELLNDSVIRIYQDVPYGARFPKFTPNVLLNIFKAGYKTQSQEVDIENSFKQKLRLISIYASQFKLKILINDITKNAYTSPEKKHATEKFWLLSSVIANPASFGNIELGDFNDREIANTEAWIDRRKKSRLVRIIMLNPSGQWAHDINNLVSLFPYAIFEIYLSNPSQAEIFNGRMERILPRVVPGGTLNWIFTCLKIIFSWPAPTLFLAGTKVRSANILSKFWLFSDTNVVSSFDVVSKIFEINHKAQSR